MKCWKCGQGLTGGTSTCVYCGAAQSRPAPTTEAGRAMRSLYDRYGAQAVLANGAYLTSGLGDLMDDSKKLRNQLKMAMDAGIGRLYLEQLNYSAPNADFDSRVKRMLTEDAGLNDKTAAELAGYFDEMIGWRMVYQPGASTHTPPRHTEERPPVSGGNGDRHTAAPEPGSKIDPGPVDKPEYPHPPTTHRSTKRGVKTVVIIFAALIALSLLVQQEKNHVTNRSFTTGDGITCSYTGKVSNGMPNGKGTMTFADGRKYEGEWKDGSCSGVGTMTFADGRKYEGEWENGQPNGIGTLTYADGSKFEGEWKDGNSIGTGTYTAANGNKYEGELTSRGTIEYTVGTIDGTTYVNEWANLEFDIPEGWYFDGGYGDSDGKYEWGLSTSGESEQGTHLHCQVYFEALGDEYLSLNEEIYLDRLMDDLGSIGNQSDRQYGEITLGFIFRSAHLDYDDMGTTESYYVHQYGNRMCVIDVLGESREENDQFVSRFTRYQGYEGPMVEWDTDENGNYRVIVNSSVKAQEAVDNIMQIMKKSNDQLNS